jgi:toxin YhaV
LRDIVLKEIPNNPASEAYRQGRTLGGANRNWQRAKFHQRFRLFFRFSSKHRVIIYAWLNDEDTLRMSGARTDPYVVFRAMLSRGEPPSDWDALLDECRAWTEADV